MGMAYTLNNEELRAQVHEITSRSYDWGAVWLSNESKHDELPMAPELLVRVLHALTEGLVLRRLLTPELVPDKVFYAAFEALACERQNQIVRSDVP